MKRLLTLLLCAACVCALGGCSLLTTSSQDENVHIYYLETEDVDDSFAVGMYFNFPARYCNDYWGNYDLGSIVQTLAENTAYEMYAKVFGIATKPVVTGAQGQLSIGTGAIRWQAQYAYSRAGGIEMVAQVVMEDVKALELYYGATGGIAAYGFTPSWGTRLLYTEDQALYKIVEGYRYENPWSTVLPEWTQSYQSDGAMGALWHGNARENVPGLGRYVNEAAFDRLSAVALTAYQLTSWHFNGCNGNYAKNAGTRTCSWGARVGGSLETPSIYRRAAKMWAWYLIGLALVTAFGFALYFGLRSGRKAVERINPPSPPVPPPADPFGDYGAPDKPPRDDNPFGSDYN